MVSRPAAVQDKCPWRDRSFLAYPLHVYAPPIGRMSLDRTGGTDFQRTSMSPQCAHAWSATVTPQAITADTSRVALALPCRLYTYLCLHQDGDAITV